MSPKDPTNIDPLTDLDDDLGDDWESAFQAEDFMFSPNEEANDFFLFDQNDSEEDIDDLTSMMENAEPEISQEQTEATQASAPETSTESTLAPSLHTLPTKLISKISTGLSFFKKRPRYQRVIATAIPCMALLLLIGTFFLRSTSEELAQREDQPVIIADSNVAFEKSPEPTIKEISPPPEIAPPPEATKPPLARTIRKQWDFPTFTIVNSTPDTETIMVNVNLSLIAILPAGASLPEEKNVWVKDIIYQFYKNRSPAELKHFALARGKMIHNLHSWLQKEWPDSPINTVIFSKYQVILTP